MLYKKQKGLNLFLRFSPLLIIIIKTLIERITSVRLSLKYYTLLVYSTNDYLITKLTNIGLLSSSIVGILFASRK